MADEQHTQHLYLVFDDWSSGYSIRKMSLSRRSGKRRSDQWSNDSSGEEDSEQQPAAASSSGVSGKFKGAATAKPLPVFMRVVSALRLSRRSDKRRSEPSSDDDSGEEYSKPPLPPVFMRISAPRGFPRLFTSAFGTKIMMILPGAGGLDYDSFRGVPAIDVKDRTITFEAEANAPAAPIYIPVSDDRLFALDIGTFEILQKPAAERSGLPWEWQALPPHPFWIGDVSSYVALPDDGCSILVCTTKNSHATCFIFDTKENAWRKYGDWTFPFTGRGYYDTSLKGFVGLSKHPETLGYLCCCTITKEKLCCCTITMASTTGTCPDFKFTKEKLYNKNPAERQQHVSATLVHMSPGKFCLVECVSVDENGRMTDQELRRWVPPGGGPQGGRVMYRVKTFSLTYDMRGDLKLQHCKVRCYRVPQDARIGSLYRDPVAFWL